MTEPTPNTQGASWIERLARDVYDRAMNGEFHGKAGLKIIPLTNYIREIASKERAEGERRFAEIVRGMRIERESYLGGSGTHVRAPSHAETFESGYNRAIDEILATLPADSTEK